MDSDALASMYAQIVRGVPKEDSRHVTDDETSQLWDSIAAEVAEMRQANPNVEFDVPNEVPDVPETADAGDDPASAAPGDDEGEGEPADEGEDKPESAEGEPEEPDPEEKEKPDDE